MKFKSWVVHVCQTSFAYSLLQELTSLSMNPCPAAQLKLAACPDCFHLLCRVYMYMYMQQPNTLILTLHTINLKAVI